jgi:hypothetical protein
MVPPILYSTNPWFATDVAIRYRGGSFFAWVSEYFDARSAPVGSSAAMIAPSSTPCRIYRTLLEDVNRADDHSALIKGYKKKFPRLAREWLAAGTLTKDQHDEIIAEVRRGTCIIWRPVLYVIPREPIEATGRLKAVPRASRAAHGPELQVIDLQQDEFDIIELLII